jgi:hypothetical protein
MIDPAEWRRVDITISLPVVFLGDMGGRSLNKGDFLDFSDRWLPGDDEALQRGGWLMTIALAGDITRGGLLLLLLLSNLWGDLDDLDVLDALESLDILELSVQLLVSEVVEPEGIGIDGAVASRNLSSELEMLFRRSLDRSFSPCFLTREERALLNWRVSRFGLLPTLALPTLAPALMPIEVAAFAAFGFSIFSRAPLAHLWTLFRQGCSFFFFLAAAASSSSLSSSDTYSESEPFFSSTSNLTLESFTGAKVSFWSRASNQ